MEPMPTAGYVRISRKDGDKVESDSIGNQKDLIKKFLVERSEELRLYDMYVDDDFTGTNFERPAFKRLMKDLETGKINCIVVKDLSRFGRDYIDVGNYLQKVFPKMGARFIAVNDNIDSGKQAYDMIMPMKNIFNEQYARDISAKVVSSIRIKQASGQFIGAFASYGYFKDPDKKGKLIVDPYAAEIVRRIFSMFLSGQGKMSIARALNDEKILCPSEYKKSLEQNYKNSNRLSSTSYWTYSTVNMILKNEIYTGKMVQHKSDFSRYKATQSRCLPQKAWIVVPDTHEAIISEETWQTVQSLLNKRTRDMGLNNNVSIFSGFLKCGDCGRAMSKISSNGRTRFVCGTYKSYSKELCSSHRIFQDELSDIILQLINEKLGQINNIGKYVEQREKIKEKVQDKKRIIRRIEKLRAELLKVSSFKMGLYEDYKERLISREDYNTYKENYQKQEETLKKQIASLEDTVKDDLEKIHENPLVKRLKDCGQLEELTRPVLDAFINKITIYQDNRIEVEYKFDPEMLTK